MHAFGCGRLTLDSVKARAELDRQAERLEKLRRHDAKVAARRQERNDLKAALGAESKELSRKATSGVNRLAKGHAEDSARAFADDDAIEAAFKHFDKDGSGTIDARELGDALQMVLGKRPKAATIRTVFEMADADGSGEPAAERRVLASRS